MWQFDSLKDVSHGGFGIFSATLHMCAIVFMPDDKKNHKIIYRTICCKGLVSSFAMIIKLLAIAKCANELGQ